MNSVLLKESYGLFAFVEGFRVSLPSFKYVPKIQYIKDLIKYVEKINNNAQSIEEDIARMEVIYTTCLLKKILLQLEKNVHKFYEVIVIISDSLRTLVKFFGGEVNLKALRDSNEKLEELAYLKIY
ncbi:MAG: hypothetical protein ACE5KT_07310 [Methanosarcinales archaeon]